MSIDTHDIQPAPSRENLSPADLAPLATELWDLAKPYVGKELAGQVVGFDGDTATFSPQPKLPGHLGTSIGTTAIDGGNHTSPYTDRLGIDLLEGVPTIWLDTTAPTAEMEGMGRIRRTRRTFPASSGGEVTRVMEIGKIHEGGRFETDNVVTRDDPRPPTEEELITIRARMQRIKDAIDQPIPEPRRPRGGSWLRRTLVGG